MSNVYSTDTDTVAKALDRKYMCAQLIRGWTLSAQTATCS
jgi:hypothetical protein